MTERTAGQDAGAAEDVPVLAMTFDAALEELERTVAELEAGGLPLERTLALYERGVALQQRCERLLGDAELRVRRLVEGARGALAEADLPESDAG